MPQPDEKYPNIARFLKASGAIGVSIEFIGPASGPDNPDLFDSFAGYYNNAWLKKHCGPAWTGPQRSVGDAILALEETVGETELPPEGTDDE